MSFIFWFFAVVFMAAALGFLLPPLLRKPKSAVGIDQKELTISVYQDQLVELDNDLANNTISQDQYEQAKKDIERNLLDDVTRLEALGEQMQQDQSTSRTVAIALAVIMPVLTVVLYVQWGAGEPGLDPDNATPVVKNDQHNQQSIEAMLGQLEQRLQQNPNDGEGWFMLARTLQFLKRYDEAVDAYAKTIPLGGNQSADVLAAYADAVAMASGRELTDKAKNLLKQALQVDPNHSKSLWLMGTASYQDKNYKQALEYWQRLYKVMEPGSQEQQQIAMNIQEVRSLLGMPPANFPSAPQAQPGGGGASISGSVSLGGAVASKANPQDTVFVFARAAVGPRMPLAIVRKQVKDLPFDFTLDDSMAMNPQMKLSGFARVVVGARVSKTGDAMPQSGDLQGSSAEISMSSPGTVKLVIDSIVP